MKIYGEIVEELTPNSTLKYILDKLAMEYGKDFNLIVDSKTGVVSSEFIVSINGRITRDINAKLNNDDVIILTIPAGGG